MTKVNHKQENIKTTYFKEGQFYVVSSPSRKEPKLFYLHLSELVIDGHTKKIWSGICIENPVIFYEHLTESTVTYLSKEDMELYMAPAGYTVEKVDVEINVLD